MHLPSKKRPGNPVLAKDWNLLIDAIQARTPRPSHGMEIISTSGGFSYRLRNSASSEQQIQTCAFGNLVAVTTEQGGEVHVIGGSVQCGSQTWQIDSKMIPGNDGDYVAYLSVSCVVYRDDDNTVFLPGVKTGTQPAGISFASNYPSGSAPEVSSGSGTIILPIGALTVTNSSPQFWPDGCGGFVVTHCNGSLSYYRT